MPKLTSAIPEFEWVQAALAEMERRDPRRFNRKAIAEAAGIGQGYLSELIRGKKGSAIHKLIGIAHACGLDLAEFLSIGKAAANRSPDHEWPIVRSSEPSNRATPDPEIAKDVGMAWSVLESNKSPASVLRMNIHNTYSQLFGLDALAEQVGLEGLCEADRQELQKKSRQEDIERKEPTTSSAK